MDQRVGEPVGQQIPNNPASQGGKETAEVDPQQVETVSHGEIEAAGGESGDAEVFRNQKQHSCS